MQEEIEKNVQLALNLKLQNLTHVEVAARMGRPVGTIKRWLAPYKDRWADNRSKTSKENALIASLKNKAKCDDLKKQAYDEAYKNAPEHLKDYLLRDFVNLYVGEGTKKKQSVSITNSDLRTILISLSVMKNYFQSPNKRIKIEIRYYQHNDNKKELLDYWSKLLKNDSSIDFRTCEQKRKNYENHNNSNKFGLLIIEIHDVYAKMKLNAYMDYLKETWQRDFEITFSTKVDESIKQVKSLKNS